MTVFHEGSTDLMNTLGSFRAKHDLFALGFSPWASGCGSNKAKG